MHKLLVVARHEYTHHLGRRGFLLATFGLPLGIALLLGLVAMLAIGSERVAALGYVDHSGLLGGLAERVVVDSELGGAVPITRFASEAAARAALDQQAIDAFFVVPTDYAQTGQVTGYALRRVPVFGQESMGDLLRQALVASLDDRGERLREPIVRHTTLDLDGVPRNSLLSFLVPFAYGLLLMLASVVASSSLMQSLVTEKESRLMEVLGTSLSPAQLMGGKILGLGLLGLTQLIIWLASAGVILLAAISLLGGLQDVALPWATLGLLGLLFVPSFLLLAASMCTVGAAVTATQEGQQLASVVTLLFISPTWLASVLLTDSDSLLALGLSLVPITAPLTILLRMAAGPVPGWQIGLGVASTTLAALGMVWVAGRVMRFGMLRYGQRLGLRELGRALREG